MGRTASGVREPSYTVATHEKPPVDAPAGTVSHALPGDLTAVREARGVVQEVLGTWRADEIFDDVVLVASELVANALRHGLQVDQPPVRLPAPRDQDPDPDRDRDPGPDSVRISLVSTGSHVICAVTDPSGQPPVRRDHDLLAGSGRGLQLVESLSLCWGWTVLDTDAGAPAGAAATQGKSVWAIFPLELSGRRDQVVGAA